jgi:putative transposase
MDGETWLSLSEVANLLGVGLRAVQKNCAAGKYLTRKTKSEKGGGKGGEVYEIALSSLPKPAQKAYFKTNPPTVSESFQAGLRDGLKLRLAEEMQARHDQITASQGNQAYIGLKGAARSRADAKLDILDALDRWLKATGQKTTKGIDEFCADYNRGHIAGLDAARAVIPDLSTPTIYRWKKAVKTQGAAALAGNYGHRKGSGLIDSQPELKDYVVAMLAGQPHTSIKNLHRGLLARFASRADLKMPSLKTAERFVSDWREANHELHTAIANPDAWKNRYMVAFGKAAADVDRLNQRWEMDSTPADVMLTDGRHSIIGVIDVYSRRLKLLVTKTSKSASVALLIRRAILDWGVPDSIKTDNGADYVSHHIRRALRFLGIEHLLCEPFQPWQKPHIERALGTFSHGPVEMMAGFIGHNVSEREAIRARQSFADRLMTKNEVVEINMDAAGLQAYCDKWTETIYYIERHEGLGGKTPQAMVLGWKEPIKTIDDPRALDLLLAEAPGDGYRTVNKGGLRIDNDEYIAPELALYARRRVHVLYDPDDLGRVYVYADEDGQTKFVCIAECPDRTGINRQAVAAKAREIQKANIQEGRKQLKQLSKKVGIGQALDEIYAAAEQADNVVRLRPHDTEIHTSAGLDAAKEAADAAGIRTLADLGDAEIIDLQTKKAAIEASGAMREEPDFDSTYQRALWLWERTIKDEPMNGEQMQYLQDYRKLEPRSWRSLDDLLKAKWGARYLDIRDQRLGLKK